MSTRTQIIAVFADSTRRVAAVLEQRFEEAGFKRPTESPGNGFSPGSGPYSFFCTDSETVSAVPLTGPERTFARVTYRRGLTRAYCPTSHATPPDEHQLRFPELKPPAGVFLRRAGGGGSMSDVNSSGEMEGKALVPSAIVAHYSAQLVAAGWTAAAPAISERVAAQFFEARDASGAPWEGVLMANGNATAVTVSLTMHPRTKP
jgi:hypothetical protein